MDEELAKEEDRSTSSHPEEENHAGQGDREKRVITLTEDVETVVSLTESGDNAKSFQIPRKV